MYTAESIQRHADNWAFVYGKPQHSARFRSVTEDFNVREVLPFEFSGEGEHVYLQIQKKSLNTMDVVKAIARFSAQPPSRIGYAGLKDKHAIATQWFSVSLPGVSELNWRALESSQLTLLSQTRHRRKLKTGAVKSNHFEILLRSVSGDHEDIEKRLDLIRSQGFANYFGEQRFGKGYNNPINAQALMLGKIKVHDRHLRGLYYSAARSWIFNEVLSARISDQLWCHPILGDAVMLNGTRGFFIAEDLDESLQQRLETCDVHLTAPLVGKAGLQSMLDAEHYEQSLLVEYSEWCEWLAHAGMKSARRAMRVVPVDFRWQWKDDNSLFLNFQLPSGSYATSLLRELVTFQ